MTTPDPHPDRVTVDRSVLHDLLAYIPDTTLHALEHHLDERPDTTPVLAAQVAALADQRDHLLAKLAAVEEALRALQIAGA
jgi:hypothetical protein